MPALLEFQTHADERVDIAGTPDRDAKHFHRAGLYDYNCPTGVLMVQVDATYTSGLKCKAVHEPSGTVLITAAPKDNMGDGSSFSPTDLVATALGTCMLTTMAIVAERHGIDLSDSTVRVVKEMSTTPPRRIAKLSVEIHVAKKVNPEHRPRLEAAAMACPVHKTISHETQMPITFKWT
jgi:putative redox protein